MNQITRQVLDKSSKTPIKRRRKNLDWKRVVKTLGRPKVSTLNEHVGENPSNRVDRRCTRPKTHFDLQMDSGNIIECRKIGCKNLQMTNDDAVDGVGEQRRIAQERKVWESTCVVIPHVHPAIKQNIASTKADQNTASAHIFRPLS